uniref:Uncharacterized protein n=1 Tax=Romanomermis culicivorax TaxID=13658 RepID=A0A915JXJ3_ROMCU
MHSVKAIPVEQGTTTHSLAFRIPVEDYIIELCHVKKPHLVWCDNTNTKIYPRSCPIIGVVNTVFVDLAQSAEKILCKKFRRLTTEKIRILVLVRLVVTYLITCVVQKAERFELLVICSVEKS